ncbi:MAG: Hpt domain-containing protein [Magnetovibrionaceae bacterium]
MNTFDDPRFAAIRARFVESTTERLDRIDEIVDARIQEPEGDPEAVEEFRREVHTIKGGGATFGFPLVSAIVHQLEEYEKAADGSDPTTWEALQLFADEVRRVIETAEDQGEETTARILSGLPKAPETAALKDEPEEGPTAAVDPALANARRVFFTECNELLAEAATALERLQANPASPEPEDINAVFRAVHSVKGGAGAWGFEDLKGFAHDYEALLARVRAGEIALSEQMVDQLFAANDALSAMLDQAEAGSEIDAARWESLQAGLVEMASAEEAVGEVVELILPAQQDPESLGRFRDEMRAALGAGADLRVSAAEVDRLSTLTAQLLLSADQSAQAAGRSFEICNPNKTYMETIELLGLASRLSPA